MNKAAAFIMDNFIPVSLLKEKDGGKTEIVRDDGNRFFVRKIIPFTGLPYKKLAALRHPCLPQIFYCAEDGGRTYIIEEYAEGSSLQQYLDANGSLAPRQVREIALQLCSALELLHSHGVLHRDIKPANIILKDDGSIKLIDFGAAKEMGGSCGHDTRILGTPGYAPPEQYGFSATDGRSDIYALGMTLKAMLPPDYRGSLVKITGRCVQLDPARRFSSAAELRRALEGGRKIYLAWLLAAAVALACAAAYFIQHREQGAPAPVPAPPAAADTAVKEQRQNEKQEGGKEKQPGSPQGEKQLPAAPAEPSREASAPAAPHTAPSSPKASVSVSWRNWDKFTSDTRLAAPNMVGAAASLGVKAVDASSGSQPAIIVSNDSGMPLENPQIELNFSNFAAAPYLYEYNSWGGRTVEHTAGNRFSSGIYRSMTIRMNGTIPPHDYAEFKLFCSPYYLLGDNPSVRITVKADNAAAVDSSFPVSVQ